MLDHQSQPQPTAEQIAQRLRLIDVRLEQRYPGYIAVLEQLRQPRPCHQDGEWNELLRRKYEYGRQLS